MPRATRTKVIDLSVGYATDLAPQERNLDFLSRAENVIFEVSRAVHKVGGGTRLNSTALTGGPSVLGQFDYWRSGAAGAFAQRYVVTTSDSKVYYEDPGTPGTFNDITGAAVIGASAIPVFVEARDVLTFWWSDASTPLSWNQTGNVATLSATAPAARCAAFHLNRLWAAGTNANPSRLYFSSSTSVTDWTGADTGAIDISPEDGDRIVGIASHKNSLIIFKGPNRGSIWVITGSAPDGGDAFTLQPLVNGIPLQSPNSIVSVGDDLWFMSDRGIHSLSATERYGNYEEAILTRYLMGYFRDSINRTRLANVWGVNYALKGMVVWTMTSTGSTNNQVFGLSYVRAEEEGLKAFVWSFTCQSAGIRIHPTSKLRELLLGDSSGFLVRMDQSTRSMPSSTAYTARVTTPDIVMGDADSIGQPRIDQVVTLYRMWLRTQPTGNYDVNVQVSRDGGAAESYDFNQGSSGFLLGTSVLGTDSLGAQALIVSAVDLLGECRALSLDITQGGNAEDMNIYELGIEYTPASEHQPAS